MTSSIAILIIVAVLVYALFGTFNAQSGGRIDAALSAVIFNGVAAAVSFVVVLAQKLYGSAPPVATRPTGIMYSLLAGFAVGAFSIVLIKIYGRGEQLSYIFPAVYGGAIALTAAIGWFVLGDTVTPLRVLGVCVIVVGIILLAAS